MASTRIRTTKDGLTFYEIRVSRGRSRSYLTTRWYPPAGWSQKAIDRALTKEAAEFERRCHEGEVTSRAEQKENDLRQKQESAKIQTLRQYGEKVFMPAKTVTMSENGRCAYQGNLDHWIYPTLGELKMPDITAADISALLLSMQSAGKANATCVKVYTILHSLFKMAYMSDVLSINPMDRVGRPKPRKSERKDKPIEAYTAAELHRHSCRAAQVARPDASADRHRHTQRRMLWPPMEGHRLQRVYRNDQRQPVLHPAKGCLLGYSEKRKGADD